MKKNIKKVLAVLGCLLVMALGMACGRPSADKTLPNAPITSKWSFESVTTSSGTSERIPVLDAAGPSFSTDDGVNFSLQITKDKTPYTGTITDNGDGTYTLTNPNKPDKPINAKIEGNVLTIIINDTSNLTFVAVK